MTSERGKGILANRHVVEDEWIPKYSQNHYDPEHNTTGAISLCLAQNKLCEDILSEKIKENLPSDVQPEWFYYPSQFWGLPRFRQTICDIINEHFNPRETIHPDDIVTAVGTTSLISMVCLTISDPGDYFLCLTPYYFRIVQDLCDETCGKCYNVPMIERHHFEDSGCGGAKKIEEYYHRAVSEGKTIKGLLLINPDNPTGKMYTASELLEILEFCKKYSLHVIADEIYGLTIHSDVVEFTSVISLKNLPDPERTHFIWGLSKDFCMNGFRCGMVHTENKDVLDALKSLAIYHNIPNLVQTLLSDVLSDGDWIKNVFLPTNTDRCKKAYKETTDVLDELEIPYYKGSAGIFIWADFSQFLPENTYEEEFKLFEEFAANGVLIYPGVRFYTTKPGYFRITFTVTADHLTQGLARMKEVCEKRRKYVSHV